MNQFNTYTTMDGKELFMQLADKVMRGELIITHFVANLKPEFDRRYQVGIRGEMFAAQSVSTKLDMSVTAIENKEGRPVPPAQVSIPAQVRELIFDEPVVPIYDEDLK